MKKTNLLILTFLLLSSILFAQEKVLHIHNNNYNEEGKIIDKNGKLYNGKGKEKLKGEGYLLGDIKDGEISGVWEYYEHNVLKGYHHYLSNGDTTYSYDLNGNINWAEVYKENKSYSIYLKNGKSIGFLKITAFDNAGKKENMFEYQDFQNNHFQTTIADYDYISKTVIDYFESKAGEQEIIIRNFSTHKELVKIMCNNHKVSSIILNGSYMDKPDDADYKLDDQFSISFTEVKNQNNYNIHLKKSNKIIFDINIVEGEITLLDKYISEKERLLIFKEGEGYIPTEHKNANELIMLLQKITSESNK